MNTRKPTRRRALRGITLALWAAGTLATGAAAQDASALSVSDCVRIALQQHPALAAARGRIGEASGRIRQVAGQKGLHVDVSSSWMRYEKLPPNKVNLLGGGHNDIYNEVGVSRLLTTGGRVEGLIDAAREQEAIERESYRRAEQQVAYLVRRAYHMLENAGEVVAYQAEAEQQMTRHLEIAKGLADVGKAATVDVLRAEVQLANVRQTLLRARNAEQQGLLALNNAMGRPTGAPLVLQAEPPAVPPPPIQSPTDEAMMAHPDIRVADLARRRAEAERRSARALKSPSLSARGAYNLEGGSDPFAIRNSNIGLVMAFPLVDGGIRRGGVEQAEGRIEQALAARELAIQRITLDVETATLSVDEARERIATAGKAEEQAAEALRVVQEKYRVGMGSSIEVIDAQVALTQARANTAQARADLQISYAQWEYAAGLDPVEGTDR